MKYIIMMLFLAIAKITNASTLTQYINGFYYYLNTSNNTASVRYNVYNATYDSYGGYSYEHVNIPSTVTYNNVTYTVTSIDGNAFNSSAVKTITIPNTVTSIGLSAFKNSKLTTINVPDNVTTIGQYAFSGCTDLISVHLGKGLSDVGRGLFNGCKNLSSITIDADNAVFDVRENCLGIIKTEDNTLVVGYSKTTIPNTVTIIGDYAFYDCNDLTSINIPNSVSNIGSYAFYRCSGLTNINIPNSVTAIWSYAFKECKGLTSIDIPNSVTIIGSEAFSSCSKLSSISIPCSLSSISTGVFSGCTNLESVEIPDGVTTISQQAFSGCKGLKSVHISKSVSNIDNINSFQGCTGLTSITIDQDNPNYDSRDNSNAIIKTSSNTLILGCTSTIIPASVQTIGERAFAGITSLTSIVIPKGVISISQEAFNGCTNLGTVDLSETVTNYGTYAFRNCTNLLSVISRRKTPVKLSPSAYYPSYPFKDISTACVLTVPYGTQSNYIAQGWTTSIFKGGIIEAAPTEISVTVGSLGVATFCSSYDLDFTDSDVKAYIVSTFTPSTGRVTLTRVKDVPAGEGIVLIGAAGSYEIPIKASETVMMNMLKGVTEPTTLNKVDGDYTNYILANKNNDLGFYAVTDGSTLSAGKAYLPLPTATLPSSLSVKGIGFDFEDGVVPTEIASLLIPQTHAENMYYNLNGQRVMNPTQGLYIVNGKKVYIK